MKKTRKLFEDKEFLEISQEEIEELLDNFNSYSIEYPTQNQIDECVENLRTYVPKKKSLLQWFEKLLLRGQIEITYINKLYWLISTLIFLITFKLAINMSINPYKIIMLISPIPLLLGFIEIFKGKENNMLELELSFKISGKQIILSRIIIIGIFNIILNTAMSILFFQNGMDVQLLKINIFWMVPFVWINLIAFIIAKNFRGHYVSLGGISFWILLVSILSKNEDFIEKIMYVNIGIYIAMALVGIYLYYRVLKKYMKTEVQDFQYQE
ncbi:hypothetical protein RBU49_05385 [Clostridium sp. MB40-C1]|uniref:hypothetical protein n=1 Tax=Clostridium sp. MB40-C1 TaxID=3070996 RepID=UPI0027E194C9|nr:hypothetical protein [Clostridium sp. MB40-C1]WMJ81680.1 hypothetical protein RBU49_05385 [Clostridium sp. MB40-C1]